MKISNEQVCQWLTDKTKIPKNIASALDRSIILEEPSMIVRLDVTQAGKILDAEQAHLGGLINELWEPE